ncbi:YbhB/YbcL family Raf kinase inhibitor-like protein [Azovibrio restrictus]|jgi:Raf kinase inhibitor-like YbhB/YbcL family protein|uniref:YbhB/YbcL family Raf kinase inhibitor-like protein n=1 Tax=Azovibrio restrictus TaxID=146938 RepID=UPI0026EDB435|nr:YbhB/YbcL family Raf kinase inhibitor-like protein [Azovibrio restrictus]
MKFSLRFILCSLLSLAASLAQAGDFHLEVDAGVEGRLAPVHYANSFGCSGGNLSPALRWSGAPAGTRSFVVTLYDPDAPTGSGWWHWVIANLPADTDHLEAGAGNPGGLLPTGARSIAGDNGEPGYLGACPPAGTAHRYVFTVHALKVEQLELPPRATPALVGFYAWAHGLGQASATFLGVR